MTTNNPTKRSHPVWYYDLSIPGCQLRPAPIWSKALAWTIIATASFGFVYAVFARIDEVVLATGELQPLGAERPVKAPFAGVIQKFWSRKDKK